MKDSRFLLRSLQDGNEISLTRQNSLVGRELECDISLDSGHISRYHAKLILEQDGVIVEDLNSTNGTYINGRRINKPEWLYLGDEVRFHEIGFELISHEESALGDMTLVGSVPDVNGMLSDSGYSDFNLSAEYDSELFSALELEPDNSIDHPVPEPRVAQKPASTPGSNQSASREPPPQNRQPGPGNAPKISKPDPKVPGQGGLPTEDEVKKRIAEARAAQEKAIKERAELEKATADVRNEQEQAAAARAEENAARERLAMIKAAQAQAALAAANPGQEMPNPGFAASGQSGVSSPAAGASEASDDKDKVAVESKNVSTAELLVKLGQGKQAGAAPFGQRPNADVDDKAFASLMPKARFESGSDKAAAKPAAAPAAEKKPAASFSSAPPSSRQGQSRQLEPENAPRPAKKQNPAAVKKTVAKPAPAKNNPPLNQNPFAELLEDDAESLHRLKQNVEPTPFDKSPVNADDMDDLQDRAERMVTSPDNGSGPRMVMLTAPVRGKVFSLMTKNKNTWVVGRSQDADLRIMDKTVSSHHARIRKLGADWMLEVNEGDEPVYLNGRAVEFTTIQPGDVIRVGRMEMIFRVDQKSMSQHRKEPSMMASSPNLVLLIGALVVLAVTLVVLLT